MNDSSSSLIRERINSNPETDTSDEDRLLNSKEVTLLLGIRRSTLQRYRTLGIGPRYIKITRWKLCYRLSDIKAWLAAKTRNRTT